MVIQIIYRVSCFELIFRLHCPLHRGFQSSLTLLITSRISELITSPITFCATCTRINAVETNVQFAFTVPVGGLTPYLKRSDGSFPQASCNWVLFPPSLSRVKAPTPRWVFKSFESGNTFRHNISLPYCDQTVHCDQIIINKCSTLFQIVKLQNKAVRIINDLPFN